ncbi:hypothetical protein EXS72_02760 [Candidatus Pacearchaeota archaeon]|nr:hypothetical protein [Candidatus Pacearchaeota archaeon]
MVDIENIVLKLGQIGLWIQAVGFVVVLWIIIEAITLFYNRKRRLLLIDIDERLKRIESKINKFYKK